KKLGADALISLNASPFEKKKYQRRHNIVQKRVSETGLPFLTVFSTGAQDDLVFDGGAFAYDGQGEVSFADDLFSSVPKDISFNMKFEGEISKIACEEEQIYQAMIHGLRDYTAKNGFRKVVLGLSGGVDSVLSSVVAVDALGAENVTVLLLPSEYTSDASFKDAYDTIHALGIAYETIPIKSAVGTILKEFSPIFENMPQDLTEENIQSRLRGLYLMTYSNKFGAMVLTTGNKSEVAVGYATLYGDMCGGYNVLKDIYKTEVYKLCHYRNANLPHGALGSKGIKIPENVIIKAPTAELRPDQKDSDSLPEYDILDDILYRLIEEEQPIEDIIQAGHTRDIVIKIWRLVHRAEYKRRQSAPGPKISKKSFTKERRYPISHSFSD
ncbi:MAG: NAD+ synthase, partial [Pseudomonadota bacterium]